MRAWQARRTERAARHEAEHGSPQTPPHHQVCVWQLQYLTDTEVLNKAPRVPQLSDVLMQPTAELTSRP